MTGSRFGSASTNRRQKNRGAKNSQNGSCHQPPPLTSPFYHLPMNRLARADRLRRCWQPQIKRFLTAEQPRAVADDRSAVSRNPSRPKHSESVQRNPGLQSNNVQIARAVHRIPNERFARALCGVVISKADDYRTIAVACRSVIDNSKSAIHQRKIEKASVLSPPKRKSSVDSHNHFAVIRNVERSARPSAKPNHSGCCSPIPRFVISRNARAVSHDHASIRSDCHRARIHLTSRQIADPHHALRRRPSKRLDACLTLAASNNHTAAPGAAHRLPVGQRPSQTPQELHPVL